jgi:hypothetical protein
MARGLGGPGGLLAIGKSKAKIYVDSDTGVTFDAIAGVDEVKEELREVVDFLKSPEQYGRLGGRMPKGVLLVGPPASARRACATCSRRRAKRRRPSSSSTSLTPLAVPAASGHTPVHTTRRSRPSISCSWRWIVLIRARASSFSPLRTDPRFSIQRSCAPAASIVRCSWTELEQLLLFERLFLKEAARGALQQVLAVLSGPCALGPR